MPLLFTFENRSVQVSQNFLQVFFDGLLQRIEGIVEFVLVHLIEGKADDLFYAVVADDSRNADIVAFSAIFAILVGGYGEDGFLVIEQAGDQPLQRQADAIISRLLAVDDLIGGIADFQVDVLQVFQGEVVFLIDLFEQVLAAQVAVDPRHEAGIAMFAQDVSVDIARRHAQTLGDIVAQACRIQDGP